MVRPPGGRSFTASGVSVPPAGACLTKHEEGRAKTPPLCRGSNRIADKRNGRYIHTLLQSGQRLDVLCQMAGNTRIVFGDRRHAFQHARNGAPASQERMQKGDPDPPFRQHVFPCTHGCAGPPIQSSRAPPAPSSSASSSSRWSASPCSIFVIPTSASSRCS